MRRLMLLGMVLIMGGSGTLHLVSPKGYEEIVPPSLGNAHLIVTASGVAELVVALLLLLTRTRRIGAFLCVLVLIAVFPANVYAASQGGYKQFSAPFDSPAVAWGRLPLQLVLIAWAWSLRDNKAQRA